MSLKVFALPALLRLALAVPLYNITNTTASLESIPPGWIPPPSKRWWPGWQGVDHMIVFGDSYTTTGFNISGEQPSRNNPFGNPAFPGVTSCNGPNWLDFLTYTYNSSVVQTLNLAWGGATVDTNLIHGVFPTYSMKQQVEDWYLPNYAVPSSTFDWRPWDTLFAFFIGINDINYGYQYKDQGADAFPKSIAEYISLVDNLYRSGARNFLFLNVPPIDRTPIVRDGGASGPPLVKSIIADWNTKVSRLARNLSATYADATTFVFDTNSLYNQVINNPSSHPETAAIKNATDYCIFYGFGTVPDYYKKDPHCDYPVDQYFWLNPLHPGFRVQNATAAKVVELLNTHSPWL